MDAEPTSLPERRTALLILRCERSEPRRTQGVVTGALDTMDQKDRVRPVSEPGIGELFAVFAKIGLLSFGGPAGQIALMHRMLVEEKRWLDEPRFLHALNYCMLLPGPEAMPAKRTWKETLGWDDSFEPADTEMRASGLA